MKKKSIFRLLILFSLSVILYGCPPDLQLTPEIVTKIYNEGGSNFCYVSVKNTSTTEPCEFALESSTSTQFLQFVSATPALTNNSILPLQTVVLKYLIKAGASAACPGGTTPCTFDKIRMMARWPNNKEIHEDVPVQWSNPVIKVDCWVRGGNVGDNDNFYQGRLTEYLIPTNSPAGPAYKYSEIIDVGNPNNFDIKILTKGLPADKCLMLDVVYPNGTWTLIPANSSITFGQIIKDNFEMLLPSCITANDAFAYVQSPSGNYTQNGEARKWISLTVTHK